MKDNLIVYFRGYNWKETEHSTKYKTIKNVFKYCDVLQFDITSMDIDVMEYALKRYSTMYNTFSFIGDSMGSILALYFQIVFQKFENKEVSLILINPSYYPEITLGDDLSPKIKRALLNCKKIINTNKNKLSINLFISLDDVRINYKVFKNEFNKQIKHLYKYKTGGHNFEGNFNEELFNIWNNIMFGQLMESDDVGEYII